MNMKNRLITVSIAFILTMMISSAASAAANAPFVPTDPILPLSQVRPGMKGEARTVVSGREITSFKVTLLGVIPRKTSPKSLILIRIDDPAITAAGGVAEGMSGSPVYVGKKLVGAIGYGWPFSEKSLGLVTPIEEMIKVHDWPDKVPKFGVSPKIPAEPKKEDASVVSGDVPVSSGDAAATSDDTDAASGDIPPAAETDETSKDISQDIMEISQAELRPLSMPILTDGISPRITEALGKKLGFKLIPLGSSSDSSQAVNLKSQPKPGSAIGVSLMWGDIQMGGIGTLTAISHDGRFVGFGHPMEGQGAVAFPLTEATILRVIPGLESSFKLGYQGPMIGLVTQDRPEAIGGRLGQLAPANSYTVRFNDVDRKKQVIKRFQTVADPFTGPALGSMGIIGIIDDQWGRNGEGTAMISYRFSGGNLPKGWERRNAFFSETDLIGSMLKEFDALSSIFALNQFQEIRPFGVDVNVEVTRDPRVVFIEKITIADKKKEYAPGEDVKLDVTIRPWRRAPTVKRFTLKVPEKAVGFCEIVVRGGGIDAPEQESLISGLRAITNINDLMKELSVQESNNQIIAEIDGPEIPDILRGVKDKKSMKDMPSPEELMDDRLQSEIRAERMKKGLMLVVDTNYYVDGLLRKYIKIRPGEEEAADGLTEEEIMAMEAGAEAGAEAGDKTDAADPGKRPEGDVPALVMHDARI